MKFFVSLKITHEFHVIFAAIFISDKIFISKNFRLSKAKDSIMTKKKQVIEIQYRNFWNFCSTYRYSLKGRLWLSLWKFHKRTLQFLLPFNLFYIQPIFMTYTPYLFLHAFFEILFLKFFFPYIFFEFENFSLPFFAFLSIFFCMNFEV